ncbi:uncharacterized protein LOC129411792 [Boleophthalmus pectinirostris]|uniref:uncharacterized protein LOC129411792 n=1 Tax=Boleophthalmus pectinirostris TaxID=150288 RepID=UPI00242DEE2A|nr:uncharacterized protein LOC129411792 [Boleophthalmus pectinirostris]
MRRHRLNPMHDACDHAANARDKTQMLDVKYISPQKGRGVFTLAPFQQGEFVVEYRGVVIDAAEAEHRRRIYHKDCAFMFDFKWKRKWWCIDATLEDNTLGRLVNDDHKTPNCRMKLIEADGKPHLCLFALRDIGQGEEITYDYGGTDWPWRNESSKKCNLQASTSMKPEGGANSKVQEKGDDATCSLENVPSTSECPTPATQGDDATCSLENVPSTSECPTPATQHDGAGNSLNTEPSATSDIPTCDNQSEDATCSLENVPFTSSIQTCATQANENAYKSTPDHSESSDDDDSACVPRLQRTKSLFMKSTLPPYEDWYESTPDNSDDYVPDSCDESSSSLTLSSTPTPKKNRKSLPNQVQSPDSTTSCLVPAPATLNLEGNEEDEEVAEGQDLMSTSKPSVVVPVVTKKSDGSRIYDKRQYCLFCFKPFMKMARHLERVHSNEKDVAYAIKFPKGSNERKLHLESLRNKGNYLHNAEVIKTGEGELVPRKKTMQKCRSQRFHALCLLPRSLL